MTSDKGSQGLNLEAQDTPPQRGTAAPEDLRREGADAPRSHSQLHARLRLHRAFRSQFLPDERDVIVYLPPGYDRHLERTYPVLYLQDGQNLFDGQTSYVPGRAWQAREHADEAIKAGEVEPLVIVGIYNTGDRRLAEYTHERDWQMGGGEAGAYGRMMTEELMPWIAGQYRVRTEREQTGVGGSSLGGLVSLFLGLRYAQHFGKLAVLSPSVWWNRKSILGYLNERAPEIWERPRVWLDVGDLEGSHTLENAEQLNRRLKANGWKTGETLHFECVAGGTHDEASWARRVRPMLRFLFPA
jgi:enterochelin esterase-like enzyme